jgi:hypothetical protein
VVSAALVVPLSWVERELPRYRLALVRVSPDGPARDEVRYVADPVSRTELGDFAAVGVTCHCKRMWEGGRLPF